MGTPGNIKVLPPPHTKPQKLPSHTPPSRHNKTQPPNPDRHTTEKLNNSTTPNTKPHQLLHLPVTCTPKPTSVPPQQPTTTVSRTQPCTCTQPTTDNLTDSEIDDHSLRHRTLRPNQNTASASLPRNPHDTNT
ncbi:extensin-like [Penaeus monodon]|uniref:extensin-like n=1 Tax=Penaeus monodon TaxID=6687 RepID=UPI0018A75DE4|nr:extensin-like [Penaeus monodon]